MDPVTGPLHGLRVVELAGLGPGPYCGMLLADMGATVLRIDRPGSPADGNPLSPESDLLNRGKQSVAVNLKHAEGVDLVLRLAERADVLFEGWRPGVAERLGVGPDACLARNPRLVYGRMTGFGQTGELAARAGHDINYIALSGALHAIGPRAGDPVPPLNIVGDFGGGALFLAFGLVCAVLEATQSTQGQVVDAAIVDGASHMMTMFHALRGQGMWTPLRGTNLLDGGAHFYGVYACADGRYLSVGAIEPRFYRQLLERLGLAENEELLRGHSDPAAWPLLRDQLAKVFVTRTRDEWTAHFAGSDACVTPVLELDEVAAHPHNAERGGIEVLNGIQQPAPAPRFSRTVPALSTPPPSPGQDSRSALIDWGLSLHEVDALLASGAVTTA